MSTLRKLVLGETWFLPLGIAVIIGIAAVVSVATPALWRDAGGPVILAAVLLVLVLAVRRS